MASVKFNLRQKDKKTSPIFMCVYYGASKIAINKTTGAEYQKTVYLKYSVDESVEVKYWNSRECRAKKTTAYPDSRALNARLNDIEKKTIEAIRDMQVENIPLNNDTIREKMDELFRSHKDKTGAIAGKELMSFIPKFIENSIKTESTKRSYSRVYKDMKEYEEDKSTSLTFNRIDIDFYNSFVSFLQSKGYAPNTIGTRIKVLKTFMNEAYDRNLHKNLDYKKKSFSKPSEDTTAVYLNESELDKLFRLDLSNNKTLSNVRDWFLIAAYTGLRFSDFSRLTKDNISDEAITIITQKTGVEVVIPLHTYVKSILEKHDYSLPKVISNQKFNEYIKEVAGLAKLDEGVFVSETKGTKTISKKEKKHNLVTAHTARRSFATNAFLAKVPPIQIMQITGHKTEKAFMTYIKITGKENARKLSSHKFFNRMIAK